MFNRNGDREQGTSHRPSIEWIAEALREPVPVRAEWRAGLLRDIALLEIQPAAREATRVGRRWQLRPVAAIAAGLVCALAGAGAAAAILQRGPRPRAPVSLTANMPSSQRTGGSTVRFVFVAPSASHVALVGDFNGWNPSTMPMRRSTDGRAWLLDVALAPGRHVYAFIVDGDLTADPAAPRAGDDEFGVPSSVVLVTGART